MPSLSQIAAFVQSLPERQKSGTLRIWGQWFGRPMDNVHTCVACHAAESHLVMKFDQGETLTLWNPSEATVVGATLSFASASRVKWEWYYYGRSHAPENLLSLEYEVADGKIMRRSNFNHASGEAASLGEPAVQFCGM